MIFLRSPRLLLLIGIADGVAREVKRVSARRMSRRMIRVVEQFLRYSFSKV